VKLLNFSNPARNKDNFSFISFPLISSKFTEKKKSGLKKSKQRRGDGAEPRDFLPDF
jgi:hypothetical protein